MFGKLKEKFNNVVQDSVKLSETLHQQYLQSQANAKSSLNSEFKVSLNPIEVPTDAIASAAAQLVAKKDIECQQIHVANEINAQLAEEAAAQIDRIEKRLSHQQAVLTDLISCLSGIPDLIEKLKESAKAIEDITKLNAEAESRLEALEDLCEECDLQEFMLQKQCELSVYKQKKMAELESYRQRIAADHQQKIQMHEQKLRQLQRERQAVFESEFRSDLEEYKRKGSLPKILKEPNKNVALEEVVLENSENKDALEEFLNA